MFVLDRSPPEQGEMQKAPPFARKGSNTCCFSGGAVGLVMYGLLYGALYAILATSAHELFQPSGWPISEGELKVLDLETGSRTL